MNKHIIEINANQCIGCQLCIKDCPLKNIKIANGKAEICQQACIQCGHCVAVCPKNAIKMNGYEEQPIDTKQLKTLESDDLLKALKIKRSIRQFKKNEISRNIIEDIIEAGRLTPTAKNAQDVSYIVLQKDIKKYEKIAVQFFRRIIPLAKLFSNSARRVTINDDFFFKQAPVAIVVVSHQAIDGGLAASHMALMAEAHGLGVLYSGFFSIASQHSRKLRKAFHINRHQKVVTTLVLGYPDVKYYRTTQREQAKVEYL